MIVEARALAGHPGQHPDVDPAVLVQQLVPPALAIDHDQRPPQVVTPGDLADDRLERLGRVLAPGRQQLGGARGELIGEGIDVHGCEVERHILAFAT